MRARARQGEICDIDGRCVDAAEDEVFKLTTVSGKLAVEVEKARPAAQAMCRDQGWLRVEQLCQTKQRQYFTADGGSHLMQHAYGEFAPAARQESWCSWGNVQATQVCQLWPCR